MKNRGGHFLGGVTLLLIGSFSLAYDLDLIPDLALGGWALLIGIASLLFFATYLANGVQAYGWLFPACSFGVVAFSIWMYETDNDGIFLVSFALAVFAIPFWVALLLSPRGNWWAAIPGWVLSSTAILLLIGEALPVEIFTGLFVLAMGLPFLTIFILDRKKWWLLIPGGILSSLGFILTVVGKYEGSTRGGFFMLGISLVFMMVFLAWRDNWWAHIPAGVTATIGIAVILSKLRVSESFDLRLFGIVLIGGIGLSFSVLWLLRSRYDTGWTKYPAVSFASAALLAATSGLREGLLLSLILVSIGAWIVYSASRPQRRAGFE